MKNFFSNYIQKNHWFWVLSLFAILLLTASFICPPTGVIDPSVIAAVGEIAGFGALGAVLKAIDKGTSAKVTHNNTTVEIGDSEN